MANTPNFNWLLPTVGGSNDTWGRILNQFAGANNLDTQLYSIASSNIGNTAPELPNGPTPGPGVIWLNDTTVPWLLQINDGSGTANQWVEIGALDPTNHTFTVASAIKSTKTTVFSTAGANTYTPDDNLIFADVQLIGGGGGGGLPSIGSGGTIAGAGGGGGCYVRKIFNAITFAATPLTVTLGAGGVAGTSSTLSAGTGGSSTFGTFLTAPGGGGAVDYSNAGTYGVVPGLGGAGGSGGDSTSNGQPGGTWATTIGGSGGASFLGAGGRGWYQYFNGTSLVTVPATPGTQGGGGGGGSNGQAGSSAAGGPGYCVIVEYLSA